MVHRLSEAEGVWLSEGAPASSIWAMTWKAIFFDAAGTLIRPNAEHALLSPRGFQMLYDDEEHAVAQTREIAERCRFSLDEIRYRYPSERLPDGKTSWEWLRELSHEGARTRYPGGVPEAVTRQVEKELEVIADLDYAGYFLTMQEIVRFCTHKGILCQGRGSAANSAVCYCLGVTELGDAIPANRDDHG